MPDPKFTRDAVIDNRDFFDEAARSPKEAFIPVKERAGQVADMLDDLAERKRDSHCKACGEPAGGRYCREHA